MKAGSGEIVTGGETRPPYPVADGLSLEILFDRLARVWGTRSGGGIIYVLADKIPAWRACSRAMVYSRIRSMIQSMLLRVYGDVAGEMKIDFWWSAYET